MRRAPGSLLGRLSSLGFVAGAVALLVLGPGRSVSVEQLALVEEGLRATGSAAGPEGAYERVLRLDLRRRGELDRLALVPDPRALRTRLRRTEPDRVLDPAALALRALALPRAGRPLLCRVVAIDAEPGDRLSAVLGATAQDLDAEPSPEGLVAELRLPPLAGGTTRVVLRWRGTRDGRAGFVEAAFELRADPPPAFALGPGLDPAGPIARALRVQGFRDATELAGAELFVGSLCRAPPGDLVARIDRGLGCLLVAEAGAVFDPSHLSYAPVVPGEALETPTSAASGRRAAGTAPAATPDAEARPAPPAKPAGGLLRPGGEAAALDSRRRRARRAALVLLVDASGSMGQAGKIAMAKEGARRSAVALGPGNDFALLAFGVGPRLLLPLGPASRKRELDDALGSLRADANSTRCLGALLEAWRLLKKSAAAVRHVVILSDGEFHDIDARRSGLGYEQIARAMRREGINLSGIRIYAGSNDRPRSDFLHDLSAWGGGRYHATSSSGDVPRLLLGVVELVRGAPAIAGLPGEREEAEPPPDPPAAEPTPPAPAPQAAPAPERAAARHALQVVDITPALAGLAERRWPPVAGYLPLEARLPASIPLSVGSAGHAFLATGLYGLGRVAAFGGSDGAPWCAALVARPWFPRLVGQLASWLLPVASGEEAQNAAPPARRVLAGDGPEPGLLAEAALRVGAEDGPRLRARVRATPRDPSAFLVGLLALWSCVWLAGRRRLAS